MSSCYSLNLELIKFKPPTIFSTSPSSSPSPSPSLSESSSPRSILTRKARTPRKRPNQTYNEAAAILSTVYPKIFPLKNPPKSLDNRSPPFLSHSDDHGYLLQGPLKKTESRFFNSFEKACEVEARVLNNGEVYDDDFSAESILDEEIKEGIDSIMGGAITCHSAQVSPCCNGYPVGLGFEFGYGVRAMRHVDEGDWWRFPCVNVTEITQQIPEKENNSAISLPNAGLRLKLDYDNVLKAWSDKGSPYSGDAPGAESAGNDVQVRLAQTDLFPEKGAPVLRYKEKRCTRLFSKKPKYQITKLNADQRPRSKGRFVKTSNPIDDD